MSMSVTIHNETHMFKWTQFITSPTLSPSKILTLPPESPCIVSNNEVAFGWRIRKCVKGSGRGLLIGIIPYLPRMIDRNLKKPQSGYTCLDLESNRPTCANLFGSDSDNRETNDATRFRFCACQMPAEERLEIYDAVKIHFARSENVRAAMMKA